MLTQSSYALTQLGQQAKPWLGRKGKKVCIHQAILPQRHSGYGQPEQQRASAHICTHNCPTWNLLLASSTTGTARACPASNWHAKTIWHTFYTEVTPTQKDKQVWFNGHNSINVIDHRNQKFIAALFTIAPIWKQPKFSSMDE